MPAIVVCTKKRAPHGLSATISWHAPNLMDDTPTTYTSGASRICLHYKTHYIFLNTYLFFVLFRPEFMNLLSTIYIESTYLIEIPNLKI